MRMYRIELAEEIWGDEREPGVRIPFSVVVDETKLMGVVTTLVAGLPIGRDVDIRIRRCNEKGDAEKCRINT